MGQTVDRYDFTVFTVSHYEEQAVSFKKVNLPESPVLGTSTLAG